jgi:hypothetical protein
LLDQIRPAFFDSRVLRESTGLPILGSVSVTPNPERMRRSRRSRWLFVGGVGSLVSVFGALTLLLMLLSR